MKRKKYIIIAITIVAVAVLLFLPRLTLERVLGLPTVAAEDFSEVTITQRREVTSVWTSDDPEVIQAMLDALYRGIAIPSQPCVGEYLTFVFHYKEPVDGTEKLWIGLAEPNRYYGEIKNGLPTAYRALFGGHSDAQWEQLLDLCQLEIRK